jgi:hypothetical protein
MKVLMHALAASCEELRARTGNPPLIREKIWFPNIDKMVKETIDNCIRTRTTLWDDDAKRTMGDGAHRFLRTSTYW